MTRRLVGMALGLMAAALVLTVLPTPALAEDPAVKGDIQSLRTSLDRIRHYLLTAEFDAATGFIKAVMEAKPKPEDLIYAIEDDPKLSDPNTGIYFLLDQAIKRTEKPELVKDIGEFQKYLQSCVVALKKDPKAIRREICKLGWSPREADRGKERLRWMAPWSVPMMIDAIMDDQLTQHMSDSLTQGMSPEEAAAFKQRLADPWARKVKSEALKYLPELGQAAVEPLCEALDMPGNLQVRISIVQTLAKIGYAHAIPFIQKQLEQDTSEQFKLVCREALKTLQSNPRIAFSGSAGKMFYQLAEAYYADQPSLRPRLQGDVLPVWSYDPNIRGVVATDVPRSTYIEAMAIRCLVRSLTMEKNQPEAVALWLAAKIRQDPVAAHYPAVLAGPNVLLRALARALQEYDFAVALGVIRALNDVGLARVAHDQAGVLQLALLCPDRRVRYETALAYRPYSATRLPGTEVAVRTLCEMLSQTGEKLAIALLPKGADASKALLEQLKAAGYTVKLATKVQEALEAARAEGAPQIDLVVVAYDSQDGGPKALTALREDFRFRMVPTLLVTAAIQPTRAAVTEVRMVDAINDSAQAKDIADAVAGIMAKVHMVPLTADDAKGYAVRAAEVIRLLALNTSTIADAMVAAEPLIRALADSRPEVVAASATTLGAFDTEVCQRTLAQACLDPKNSDPAKRLPLLKALASSARRFGNKLTEVQLNGLVKLATGDPDGKVRLDAGIAAGALGLTIESIILNPPQAPAAP